MSADTPSGGRRLRRAVSILLIVLAGPVALGGGVLLYVREEIVDSRAFADRAADILRIPAVSHVAAKEFAVQVVEPAVPDSIAARPLVIDGLDRLIRADAFRPILRTAAEHGHRLLFERGSNAVFDVADAGAVVTSALQTLAPKIAKELPKHAETVLLTIRRRSFAGQTLYYADHVRWLGVVLPVVAIALLAAGIAIAPDRRRAITLAGIVVGVCGAVLALALLVVRHYVTTHVYGAQELTNADVRHAVGGIWTGLFGDLMTWALWVGAVAWLIAAASAALLSPYSAGAQVKQLRAVVRGPLSQRGRAARAVVALALGLFAVLKPRTLISVVVVLAGAALIYGGFGELLSVTAPAQPRSWPSRRVVFRRVAAVAGVFATAVIAFVAALLVTGGARSSEASTIMACNGYPVLCDRRLDEVVFAGTHNSMSAADSHGWLIANQDRDINQQLQDGIRAFKISTHYATEDAEGGVHTDIAAEGTNLNRVAKKLDPRARLALQRLSVGLGTGSLNGRQRDIWLCHTLCELGATRMVDFLGAIRTFLNRRPNNVLILFDEDYVSERDLRAAFVRAKLFRRLAVLNRNAPLPTLGSLIRSRHNVIVFAQKETSGHYPWNHDAFGGWIQDTLLGVTKPAQFTCAYVRERPGQKSAEARGAAGSPLLMMNNWADIFPPRPGPNVPLQQRGFILKRARQCVQERGRIPNLILTDYYNRGDVIGAVNQLNGVSGAPSP